MTARGFTLLEMIMTMVLLAVVGLSMVSIISQSSLIYVDTAARELLLQEGRFVAERLVREVRLAVPNSVLLSQNDRCLEWVPVRASGIYSDLPLAATNKLTVIPDGTIQANQRAVIYPVKPDNIFAKTIPAGGENNVAIVAADLNFTPAENENMVELTFAQQTQFPAGSPASRFYIYDQPVAYCLEGTQIWRYSNYKPERENLTVPDFSGDGVRRVLMAEHVAALNFNVDHATLTRNGLVKFSLEMTARGETVRFDQDAFIANAP